MNSATVAPRMRPILARISSAASGLRFCGMIDDPVDHLSDIDTNRNWADDQITSSSARRDMWTAQMLLAARNSSAKIPVADRVQAVGHGTVEIRAAAVMSRSMG